MTARLFAGHRVSRFIVLDLGLFHVTAGRTIGIPGFLIETDRGARILVDTGFPAHYAVNPDLAARTDGLDDFGHLVDYSAAQTITGALAMLGLRPSDIDALILTHGHIDHVGGLPLFTHCPVILTRAERADPRPAYFRTARPMEWPAADYRLIDADTILCDGLTLIPTPGHTPGHLSISLALPQTGHIILAADAINRQTEPTEGFPDAADPVTAALSAARLLNLAAESPAMIIYGHDPAQWHTLRKSPESYT